MPVKVSIYAACECYFFTLDDTRMYRMTKADMSDDPDLMADAINQLVRDITDDLMFPSAFAHDEMEYKVGELHVYKH